MRSSPAPVVPDVPGVRHEFATVDGVRIHYAEAGQGDPVVLLHTFPQHWYAWRHVIPELATGMRVICPDFRGAGWSEAPPSGYGTEQRARDILGLLDELGLERVVIVGHGWGAWAGFRMCLDAPERVQAFLSLGMTHPWPPRRASMLNAWRQWHTAFWEYPVVGRAVLRHWPAFTRFLLRHWAHDAEAVSAEDIAMYAEAVREPARARAGQSLLWSYVVHDIPKLVFGGGGATARVAVPTTIITGDADVVIPPSMTRGGAAHFDDLTVEVLAGAGHLLPEERPDAVIETVRKLVAGGS
jgi:pimeloyl-ACP methyl ester carboxylesterase